MAKPAPKKPQIVTPQSRTQARAEGLNDWFAVFGLMSMMRGNLADAGAFDQHGPVISQETAEFAESNESVAKYVDMACQMGPIAALMAAVAPLAMQLAVNHGRLDPKKLSMASGVVPPDVLEAKVTAAMEQQKAEYLRQAQEARRQIEQLREQNGES